jgi:hypothetical protein
VLNPLPRLSSASFLIYGHVFKQINSDDELGLSSGVVPITQRWSPILHHCSERGIDVIHNRRDEQASHSVLGTRENKQEGLKGVSLEAKPTPMIPYVMNEFTEYPA